MRAIDNQGTHRRSWAWVTVAGLLACAAPKTETTPVRHAGVLEPLAEPTQAPSKFEVVASGPRGELQSESAVQVIFSQPLRSLDAEVPVPAAVQIEPSLGGHWEWVGTSGLAFAPPAGRLPPATAFSVRIAKGLQSARGELLAEDFSYSFETPRPRVLESGPDARGEKAHPHQPITLVLSQDVVLDSLRPFLTVSVQGKPAEFELRQRPKGPVEIIPVPAWPLGAQVTYALGAGWKGTQGALPAKTDHTGEFATIGPLRAFVRCDRDATDRCMPGSYLTVEFSSPVLGREAALALSAGNYPLKPDTDWNDRQQVGAIYCNAPLRPGDRFTISVNPRLRDVWGQRLVSLAGAQVVVGDYAPTLRTPDSGATVPPDASEVVFSSMNQAFDLRVAAVTPEALEAFTRVDDGYEHLRGLPQSVTTHVAWTERNRPQYHRVALDTALGGASGLLAYAARYIGSDAAPHVTSGWLQRSGLSATVKQGRTRTHLWVTDWLSAKPVPGAQIRPLSGGAAVGTDASGIAVLPDHLFVSQSSWNESRSFLVVRKGQDQVVLTDESPLEPYRIEVATDFWGDAEPRAFVLPERDLFRPGEGFSAKVYVRTPSDSGLQIPKDVPLRIRLRSPEGAASSELGVSLNSFGTAAFKLKIPPTASLGFWSLEVEMDGAVIGSRELQVSEYVPIHFETRVRSRAPEAIAQETGQFEISARYLFGAPLVKAPGRIVATRQPAQFSPPVPELFSVSDSDFQDWEQYVERPGVLVSHDIALSSTGELVEKVPLSLPNMVGPELVTLEAEVSDVDHQTQAARAQILVHPAAFYLALKRPDSYFVTAGEALKIPVLALSPGGERVSSKLVQVELLRRSYQLDSPADPSSGRWRFESVASCSLRTGPSEVSCPLAVKESGYHVAVARSQDEKGRRMQSSLGVWAVGGSDSAWPLGAEEDDSLPLKLDRLSYRTGETAKLLVNSPFPAGLGWLTIERDNVLESRVITVPRGISVIPVPVQAGFGPNVHIALHLLDTRPNRPRSVAPEKSYRVGYVTLSVDSVERELNVRLSSSRPSYQPGDEVVVDVHAVDSAGRAHVSEATVFVVDEGVLLQSRGGSRNPLSIFGEPMPLRVRTIEGRASVLSLERLAGLWGEGDMKGAPGGGGEEGRSEFLTTAFFEPSLRLDPKGHGQVKFRLPANLGAFRIMATVASQTGRYGAADRRITVSKPLMARPSLPRFVRVGDEYDASVVVSRLEGGGDLPVPQLDIAGVARLSGPDSAGALGPGGSAATRFRVRAEKAGSGRFTFQVQSATENDRVTARQKILPVVNPLTVAAYGETDDLAVESLGSLASVLPDVGGLQLNLAGTALLGLDGAFSYLTHYQYGCTEQLSSRALPWLAFRPMAKSLNIALPPELESGAVQALAQLLRRQMGDGGFAMWSDATESEPWVSPYALWVLHLASKQGIFVPPDTLERGRRFLMELAKDSESSARFEETAWAVFVLGQMGRADHARTAALWDQRNQLTSFSRWLLLWAAADQGQHDLAKEMLRELEGAWAPRGNRLELLPDSLAPHDPFGSSVRTHAVSLGAIVRAHPKHPLLPRMVRGLLDARRGATWATTQETAFALLALDAYRKEVEVAADFESSWQVGGAPLGQARITGSGQTSVSFPMAALASGSILTLHKQGPGRLFYETRLTYAPKALPTSPLEAGFSVAKRLRKVSLPGLELGPVGGTNTFQAGDWVLGEVEVLASGTRRFVVLDDPLPAGFEAIDSGLEGSSQLSLQLLESPSQLSSRRELRDDRVVYFADTMAPGLYLFRYLARATTAGRFVVPPTVIREMYQEEVMGRTAARHVVIER